MSSAIFPGVGVSDWIPSRHRWTGDAFLVNRSNKGSRPSVLMWHHIAAFISFSVILAS